MASMSDDYLSVFTECLPLMLTIIVVKLSSVIPPTIKIAGLLAGVYETIHSKDTP